MDSTTDTIESFVNSEYKYGFVSDIETDAFAPGLSHDQSFFFVMLGIENAVIDALADGCYHLGRLENGPAALDKLVLLFLVELRLDIAADLLELHRIDKSGPLEHLLQLIDRFTLQ